MRVARHERKCLHAARFFMRYTRFIVLLSVAIALLATACGGGSKTGGGNLPTGVVAAVKGEQVTKAQLERVLDRARRGYKAQKRAFPKAGTTEYQQLVQSAVKFMVERIEYEQKAGQLGVKVGAADVVKRRKEIIKQYFGGKEKAYLTALKKQGSTDADVRDDIRALLVQEGISKKVTAGISVSDDEVHAYYLQHPQLYSTPESRDVRHILVKTKKLADSIYAQLCGTASPCVKAKSNFAALAKKYSTDPGSKNQGGKLTVVRGQTVPEFDKTAFLLKLNEISKPVKTQYGYHVIQAVSNTHPRKATPFAQVKAAIKQQLLSTRRNAKLQKFQDDLKKEYATQVKYAAGYEPPATTSTSTGATTTG
jgi:foldase protein PrsA